MCYQSNTRVLQRSPSRERGILAVGVVLLTLTFDSSPIKGEGILSVGVVLLLPHPVDTALKPV